MIWAGRWPPRLWLVFVLAHILAAVSTDRRDADQEVSSDMFQVAVPRQQGEGGSAELLAPPSSSRSPFDADALFAGSDTATPRPRAVQPQDQFRADADWSSRGNLINQIPLSSSSTAMQDAIEKVALSGSRQTWGKIARELRADSSRAKGGSPLAQSPETRFQVPDDGSQPDGLGDTPPADLPGTGARPAGLGVYRKHGHHKGDVHITATTNTNHPPFLPQAPTSGGSPLDVHPTIDPHTGNYVWTLADRLKYKLKHMLPHDGTNQYRPVPQEEMFMPVHAEDQEKWVQSHPPHHNHKVQAHAAKRHRGVAHKPASHQHHHQHQPAGLGGRQLEEEAGGEPEMEVTEDQESDAEEESGEEVENEVEVDPAGADKAPPGAHAEVDGEQEPKTPDIKATLENAFNPADPSNYFPVEEGNSYRFAQFWNVLKPIYPVLAVGMTGHASVGAGLWFPVVLNHLLPMFLKLVGAEMNPAVLPIPPGYLPNVAPPDESKDVKFPPGVRMANTNKLPEGGKFAPAPPPPPIPPPLPDGYEQTGVSFRGHILIPGGLQEGMYRGTQKPKPDT